MGVIVTGDDLRAGLGDHADQTTLCFLTVDDSLDAGINGGDMRFYIGDPFPVFCVQFFVGKIVILPTHIYKSQMIAAFCIFPGGDGNARTKAIQYLAEKRIIYATPP